MPPRYSREEILAAVAEVDAGIKAPVVCQRHGMSERTLYRWCRMVAHERRTAGAPAADAQGAARELAADALRIVVAALGPAEQLRALHGVETALRLTRARARELLGLACDPSRKGG